jgi:hypothetical protein
VVLTDYGAHLMAAAAAASAADDGLCSSEGGRRQKSEAEAEAETLQRQQLQRGGEEQQEERMMMPRREGAVCRSWWLEGTIVGRRVLGKHLAFATLRLRLLPRRREEEEATTEETAEKDREEAEDKMETAKMKEEEEEDDVEREAPVQLVKVQFRRLAPGAASTTAATKGQQPIVWDVDTADRGGGATTHSSRGDDDQVTQGQGQEQGQRDDHTAPAAEAKADALAVAAAAAARQGHAAKNYYAPFPERRSLLQLGTLVAVEVCDQTDHLLNLPVPPAASSSSHSGGSQPQQQQEQQPQPLGVVRWRVLARVGEAAAGGGGGGGGSDARLSATETAIPPSIVRDAGGGCAVGAGAGALASAGGAFSVVERQRVRQLAHSDAMAARASAAMQQTQNGSSSRRKRTSGSAELDGGSSSGESAVGLPLCRYWMVGGACVAHQRGECVAFRAPLLLLSSPLCVPDLPAWLIYTCSDLGLSGCSLIVHQVTSLPLRMRRSVQCAAGRCERRHCRQRRHYTAPTTVPPPLPAAQLDNLHLLVLVLLVLLVVVAVLLLLRTVEAAAAVAPFSSSLRHWQ